MRIHFRYVVVALALALALDAASCSIMRPRPSVDIDIRNETTNTLNWVKVLWDDGQQSAGVMVPGTSSVLLDAGLPKSPRSDTAFMEFVNDKDGWAHTGKPNSERKRYRVPVDVSALKRLSPGHYRVTFSITSFTEAKLKIEKKDK